MTNEATPVVLDIAGYQLPGTSFEGHHNVHIGLECGKAATGLVLGDVQSAHWSTEVLVRRIGTDGVIDFAGPAVNGTRQQRFIRLTWGNVEADGSFVMFRRIKLLLGDIPGDVLERALTHGTSLTAKLSLTGTDGTPTCGSVRPPRVEWSG